MTSSLFDPIRGECIAAQVLPLGAAPAPIGLLRALRPGGHAWMLDSALHSPGLGRMSFAGHAPYAVVRAQGTGLEVECLRASRPGWLPGRAQRAGDPFELLPGLLPSAALDANAARRIARWPFAGGLVGFWGYELGRHTEPVALAHEDDLGLPEGAWLLVDRLVAIDHARNEAVVIGLGFARDAHAAQARADAAARALLETVCDVPAAQADVCEVSRRAAPRPRPESVAGDAPAPIEPGPYGEKVRWLLERIRAGALYQANLTERIERAYSGSPLALYQALRETSPAPFAAYLELPECAVLSSSPERFLSLRADGRVESRPIKGTRPRGANEAVDRALERELASAEKDGAENLMIVDLVRNDLGRVCEIGSVAVPELRVVERYATVLQLVSSVTGKLRAGVGWSGLLRATFPPGSMTGAPKIAAMRAIEQLEPVRRGIYSGALGYVDLRGGADLSVVIRTIVLTDGRALLHVGGGIVADSDPVLERREALDKAAAMLEALERASAEPHARALSHAAHSAA